MKKRMFIIGNCPVCLLGIVCVGDGKTPRHGHIKTKKWGWLPSCPGSGKPAIWVAAEDEFYFSNIEVDYVKKSYQLNTT